MARESKVTLTLTEADARWLMHNARIHSIDKDAAECEWCTYRRIKHEIQHALAECDCDKGGTR